MATQIGIGVSAVLCGLDDEIANDLARALRACCREVQTVPRPSPGTDKLHDADVIFCPADVAQVRRLKSEFPQSPLVVASRLPDVSDWLDALEAGASDYCAAPFEPTQLRWVLETHLGSAAAA